MGDAACRILFTIGFPYEIAPLSWGSSSCWLFAKQILTGDRAELLKKIVIRIRCVSVPQIPEFFLG